MVELPERGIQAISKLMSEAYSLAAADFQKWGRNLLLFLIPVILIYITFVIAAINDAGGTFSFSDLIPNAITVGAMVLYVLNGLTDLLRKFVPDTTPAAQQ